LEPGMTTVPIPDFIREPRLVPPATFWWIVLERTLFEEPVSVMPPVDKPPPSTGKSVPGESKPVEPPDIPLEILTPDTVPTEKLLPDPADVPVPPPPLLDAAGRDLPAWLDFFFLAAFGF
jgi:hypothetical protein